MRRGRCDAPPLTGYAGGLGRKRTLLEIEHALAVQERHAPAAGLW